MRRNETEIRLISATLKQELNTDDTLFPSIENNGEIEIVAELIEPTAEFHPDRTEIVSVHLLDFDIFKEQVKDFEKAGNETKGE